MPPIELNIRFPNHNQVIVGFETKIKILPFQSPFALNDFSDMAWYLETYATSYIADVDIERADEIANRLKALGEKLFNSVFADETARRLFNRFQKRDVKRLITISANHSTVLSLPWELLRQPRGTFLMNEKLSIRRRYEGGEDDDGRESFEVESKDSLRTLFVVSRPEGEGFLNPRSEAQAVMQALQEKQANIELEFLRPATLDKLIERLENDDLPPIDILHFDGHGAFCDAKDHDSAAPAKHADNGLTKHTAPKGKSGYLLFEKADGGQDLVSAESLADSLYRKQIALVVLSACQSATVGGEDALNSVAARLTHAGLPSVLAMTYSVLVATTEKLFAAFYAELMKGKHIGESLDTARRYLDRHSERGERQCGAQRITLNLQDWFVPALYQASHDSALFKSPPAPLLQRGEQDPGSPLCKRGVRGDLNNLPKHQDAGFFGRNKELWQIERAFVRNVRSVAITGFGGQGKTTLAIEAGDWLQQTGLFSQVCFVDYAAFQGVDAVGTAVSTLATVLNESLIDADAATQALQKTATLLILDNLEALAPNALTALLTAAQAWATAGRSRLLMTTRQHDLAHAAFPPSRSSRHLYLPLAGLGQEDALAYFQRLHKLPPVPDDSKQPERAALLALFAMVDFHPLSIGLLAQELKFRRPAELGRRLEHYLAKNPDNPLIGSLKLSLDRLEPAARLLVTRLGVFQGGAMEEVLLKITEINVSDWVSLRPALASTGLIQAESLAHLGVAAPYLKFHPTLAPALWQELKDDEQAELVARYRYNYYSFSRFLYFEDQKNPHAVRAIARRELPNCLHGVYAALQAGEGFAVEFATCVSSILNHFGLHADKAALNLAAQQAGGDIGSESWYLTQSSQGEALFYAGQYAKAETIFQALRQQLGRTPSYKLCATLDGLGRCLNQQGKAAAAVDCYEQALAIAQSLDTSHSIIQRLTGSLHTDLATAFMNGGDYVQAKAHYEQSLAIAEKIGETRGVAVVQGQLGTLAMAQGDLHEAEQRYQSALKMFASLNEPKSEATAWYYLGMVYQRAEAWQAAEHAYRESARINEALGDTLGAASTWNALAILTAAQGKPDAAEQWYRKAIAVQEQVNSKSLASSLNNLAVLLQNQAKRIEEARALAEQALTICETLDAASVEIWNTYHILAQIADKQQHSAKASQYRQSSRDSYLRFAGMPTQMKRWARFIAAVLNALSTQNVDEELTTDLQNLQQQGRTNLANAIHQLLNGERNEAVLLEPLNYQEAAIIHLILLGIAKPDSLADLFNA